MAHISVSSLPPVLGAGLRAPVGRQATRGLKSCSARPCVHGWVSPRDGNGAGAEHRAQPPGVVFPAKAPNCCTPIPTVPCLCVPPCSLWPPKEQFWSVHPTGEGSNMAGRSEATQHRGGKGGAAHAQLHLGYQHMSISWGWDDQVRHGVNSGRPGLFPARCIASLKRRVQYAAYILFLTARLSSFIPCPSKDSHCTYFCKANLMLFVWFCFFPLKLWNSNSVPLFFFSSPSIKAYHRVLLQ